MKYEVIFDAAAGGYRNWPFAAAGALFVMVGIVLVKHRRNVPAGLVRGMGPEGTSAFAFFFLGFAILWTTVALAATGWDYLSLRGALREGRAEVVEGRVENFSPMPASGHAMERLAVCGVPFSYSDYHVTAGFNRTRSHGGPMRDGLWVRITYVGNDIGRLEVAREDPGEKAECRSGGGSGR